MISEENLIKIQQNKNLEDVPMKILINVLVELEMMGALKKETWEGVKGYELS